MIGCKLGLLGGGRDRSEEFGHLREEHDARMVVVTLNRLLLTKDLDACRARVGARLGTLGGRAEHNPIVMNPYSGVYCIPSCQKAIPDIRKGFGGD